MRFIVLLVLVPLMPAGEPPANLAWNDVAAAMARSIERQRTSIGAMADSVQRQRQSARSQAHGAVDQTPGTNERFTIPWPKPPVVPNPVTANCEPLPAPLVESLVEDNARLQALPPEVIREVMRRESGFRNCAESKAGAQGLMQLMPDTARQFGVQNVFDPRQNVAAGAKFLRLLIDRYQGDLSLALGAYNAGPARVDEAGGVPAIPETRDYISAILDAVSIH